MIIHVLLVEPLEEDARFLREVLADLDAAPCWNDWINLKWWHAAAWEEAEAILVVESVEVLLLGVGDFEAALRIAPNVPAILLVEPSSVQHAERLIRDG